MGHVYTGVRKTNRKLYWGLAADLICISSTWSAVGTAAAMEVFPFRNLINLDVRCFPLLVWNWWLKHNAIKFNIHTKRLNTEVHESCDWSLSGNRPKHQVFVERCGDWNIPYIKTWMFPSFSPQLWPNSDAASVRGWRRIVNSEWLDRPLVPGPQRIQQAKST